MHLLFGSVSYDHHDIFMIQVHCYDHHDDRRDAVIIYNLHFFMIQATVYSYSCSSVLNIESHTQFWMYIVHICVTL